ncbi:MAG: FkbM family methyltransferase [Firmicutes bacterium]|nr:FkbM family methyltransferase [Bacillota bacterium]
MRLNGLSNVRVIRKAAWSHAGLVGWYESQVPLWHKVAPDATTKIEAVTVDELVEQFALPRVDWIKVDVEGGEVEVLRGAWRTLEQFRPVLLIEVHQTLAALRTLLEPAGWVFEALVFDEEPPRHGWVRCVHPARQCR